LCIVLHVTATPSYYYEGNASFSQKAAGTDWEFRETALSTWNLLLWLGANFESISVGGTRNSASGDVVYGAASVNVGAFPVAYLAYFDASIGWNSSQNWAQASVNTSAGYIGCAYLKLIEQDAKGNVVQNSSLMYTYDLLKLSPYFPYVQTESSTSGSLKWVTFQAQWTNPTQPWTFSLSWIVSDVLGLLNQGNAVLSPKSLESVVSIQNWPYLSSSNTLSLVIATATGQGSSQDSAYVTGTGVNQVYFNVNKNAVVGGTLTPVQISGYTKGDFQADLGNADMQAQVVGKYGAQASLQLVTVTFPAGASDIVYDPTIGVGSVPGTTSASPTFTGYVIITIAFVLVSLLVV